MMSYPEFSREQMGWLVDRVRAVIPECPDDLQNVARHKDGLDLQLELYVAARSQEIFTPEVCINLEKQVAEYTGVMKPVVYLHGNPHPEAAEALDYAAHRL